MQQAREILDFWFGALTPQGWTVSDNLPLWFGGRAADDDAMRQRFGALIEDAAGGRLAEWENHSDDALMALILLTDQMTRAAYRGSAQAFCGDAVALTVCKNGIADGRHKRLPPAWRRFYYLPLEHSEGLADQADCVQQFRQLLEEYPQYAELDTPGASLTAAVEYAQLHYDIIERFGRFPHRNALLGRTATQEEEDYLANGGEHFGQRK